MTELALAARSASPDRIAAGTAIDAGGLVPDPAPSTAGRNRARGRPDGAARGPALQPDGAVHPGQPAAPGDGRLAGPPQVRRERLGDGGPFARGYKGPGHPHTNMAKAALNMLTRTSAAEMLEQDGILMTAVDTGWITDERPHPTKVRLAEEGFHAPLDLVDGAARSTTRSCGARPARICTAAS